MFKRLICDPEPTPVQFTAVQQIKTSNNFCLRVVVSRNSKKVDLDTKTGLGTKARSLLQRDGPS